jgi:hypothetical protein
MAVNEVETVAFKGKELIGHNTLLDNKVIEQVCEFKYLGNHRMVRGI